MDTGMTSLPTLTDASLGQVKSDPGWAVSRPHQILLTEWNAAMAAVKEIAQFIGVDGSTVVGATSGTVQGILRRFGWGDVRLYRWHDHFEYRAAGALDPRWNLVSGSWATVDEARGIVRVPLDGGVENLLRWQGFPFYRAALPVIQVRIVFDNKDDAPVTRIGFRSSAGNDGWGVEWSKAASAFFRVYTLIGGAYVYVATAAAPVVGTWNDIRISISGTPGAQVVTADIDGAVTSSAASALALVAQSPLLSVGSGAVAVGKFARLDLAALEADFTQADA